MATLEEYFEQATAPGPNRQLPGCVMIAANKDGIAYSKCFGTQSVDPVSPLVHAPLTLETTMWIASCTKLMTAISAVQCVEKGLLYLDDDISTVLSEWKDPKILVGFEDASGEPILQKADGKITLRMLLTHQSGMGYTFVQQPLEQYAEYMTGKEGKALTRMTDSYFLPLLYEPGTSWSYGIGIDWAGQMVERVTKQSLGSYMEENIWKPLGMNLTTFRLQQRPDILSRRADMSMRASNGGVVPSPTRFFQDDAPDDHGGGGVFSCAGDHIKVLIALLKNDGTLLKPSSIDLLSAPYLPPGPLKAFRENRAEVYQKFRAGKIGSESTHKVDPPLEMNYALGGQVSEKDWQNGRKAGSMSWGGLPNLSWVLDRKAGLALAYYSQLLPPGDPASRAAFERFEYAVYSGELGNVGPQDLEK